MLILRARSFVVMSLDPRRARDPRLARADPRLQRPQSGSPAPPPLAQPDASLYAQNGGISAAPEPLPVMQMAAAGPSQPHIPLANPVMANTPLQNGQPSFKIRPLFCVVCASNQVSVNWLHDAS